MVNEGLISNPHPPTSLMNKCEGESACPKQALFSCHHCSKFVCLAHLNEHNTLNIIRADGLSDEINNLKHLVSKMNTEKSFEISRNKLNKWKKEMVDNIESIYKIHSNEINNVEMELNYRLNIFKENLETKLSNVKTDLSTLQKILEIPQQKLSPIECDINQLRQRLESLRCEISIEIKNTSFKNLINVQNIFSYNRTIPNTTQTQSYRTISVENMTEFVINKTNGSILWLDNHKQLHYMDKNYQNHRLKMETNDTDIVDIKWCSSLDIFLILFSRHLFSFDYKTDKFTQIPIARYKTYPFRCITCLNDTSFYISYLTSGICIELWKYSSINTIEYVNRWECLTNDKNEWVSDMKTNSALDLGLIIRRGSSIYRRFELRDQSLNLLKTIQLDHDYIDGIYPFGNNHWFIKSLSSKYYVYSKELDKFDLLLFDFPFGLEEFAINSMVIGNKQGELTLRDIY